MICLKDLKSYVAYLYLLVPTIQWYKEISNTHVESHNKSPDIQPHDSASNVGFGLSKACSRTPPQLARQQIGVRAPEDRASE